MVNWCKIIKITMLCLFPLCGWAQEYNGTTGLLHVPSAEMDSAGTFRGGGTFLDKRFTPDQMARDGNKYNTFNYFIGLTAMPWLEVSYASSLLYMYKNNDTNNSLGYYNEDRRVNVKLRPLKEGRWWPAIAVGMDDIGRFNRISEGNNANNYFQNIYVVGSKNFSLKDNILGVHLAYRYYTTKKNTDMTGVAAGVSLRPRFYNPLRFIVEWDGRGVNVGADVLLWRHLFVQASLIHGKGFMGGLSYHYTIKF